MVASHRAFDHQRVAIGDLDAFQLDVGADGQLALAFLRAAGDDGSRRGRSGCGSLRQPRRWRPPRSAQARARIGIVVTLAVAVEEGGLQCHGSYLC
jgi:hypothetical protein